jgi:hypothetical protein
MVMHSSRAALVVAFCLYLAACDTVQSPPAQTVESSGKEPTGLQGVPQDVMHAARSVRPELELEAAEHEVRNGQHYYDLAGKMPDGSEIELDLTIVDGTWTVVEVQRDIGMGDVPEQVREQLSAANPAWMPRRIIESDQGDNVVIYEFFGPGTDGDETKVEVKWEAGVAEVLRDEWVH